MIILEAENGLGFGAEKHQQIMHELLLEPEIENSTICLKYNDKLHHIFLNQTMHGGTDNIP
jgi:hypothetical protein